MASASAWLAGPPARAGGLVAEELPLFLGDVRFDTMEAPGSATLTVRLRSRQYLGLGPAGAQRGGVPGHGHLRGSGTSAVRAIFALLDEELDIGAQMLGRVLMETTVTLRWLAKDFPARITSWRLHDAKARLSWDGAFAKVHGGEALMSAEGRREIEALRDQLRARGGDKLPEF